MSLAWDAATAERIGLAWLANALAPAGDLGRRALSAERAWHPGDEPVVLAALARAARIATALGEERLGVLRALLGALPDPSGALARAAAGEVLADADFFELARFLEALRAAEAATAASAFEGVARPRHEPALEAALAPGLGPQRSFYVADAFDSSLATARGRAAAAEAAAAVARTRLRERVARALGLDHLRDGEFVLVRDALRGALPPEVRVLREAATYLLCELAMDEPALAAAAEREAAAAVVAAAEDAVRGRLTELVAAAAPALLQACGELGALDRLVARALFAARHGGVVPELVTEPVLAFDEARFLPLEHELAARGLPYVPISLELAGCGVVTGPNMGGKTAALRTAGFVVACVALGLPVPARSARVPLVDTVAWLGLGTSDEGEGLSAFGAEVVRLRTFLAAAPARPLVLVDEFARTTSPAEGRALLIGLLQTLAEGGRLALAATHFDGVAQRAGVARYALRGLQEAPLAPGDSSLAEILARLARATDFRLVRVMDDHRVRHDALVLAEALGLDEALLARARTALRADGDALPVHTDTRADCEARSGSAPACERPPTGLE